jgi:hypothetical protein
VFRNLSRGTERRWTPVPPELRAIVEAGGWEAAFRARLLRERRPMKSPTEDAP